MKFKPVDFSQVPAFDRINARLGEIDPGCIPEKAGKEFDAVIYRIYVKRSSEDRIPIDVDGNLLLDIRDNPRGSDTSYSQYLIAKLDQAIKSALAEGQQL